MKRRVNIAVAMFAVLVVSLGAFALLNPHKPCTRTAEGCWYCYFKSPHGLGKYAENIGKNPELAAAVNKANRNELARIQTTKKTIYSDDESLGYEQMWEQLSHP